MIWPAGRSASLCDREMTVIYCVHSLANTAATTTPTDWSGLVNLARISGWQRIVRLRAAVRAPKVRFSAAAARAAIAVWWRNRCDDIYNHVYLRSDGAAPTISQRSIEMMSCGLGRQAGSPKRSIIAYPLLFSCSQSLALIVVVVGSQISLVLVSVETRD